MRNILSASDARPFIAHAITLRAQGLAQRPGQGLVMFRANDRVFSSFSSPARGQHQRHGERRRREAPT